MPLIDTVMLASFSARSKAYLQALAKADLLPRHILIYGDPSQEIKRTPQDNENIVFSGIDLPDLTPSLIEICEINNLNFTLCHAQSINDSEILDHLTKLSAKIVIYSGYGGQLVSEKILKSALYFLHLHSGWLPNYRGSTTIYYSWLKHQACGVSAILLDQEIDTGRIIARKEFPIPPANIDVDLTYDNAIRANLLVDVLKRYKSERGFTYIPREKEFPPYYVIHPVLKHIALLTQNHCPETEICID